MKVTTLREKTLDQHIVVDLNDLAVVTPNVLRCLIRLSAHVRQSAEGSVRLIGVSEQVRRTLEVAGVSHLFKLEE